MSGRNADDVVSGEDFFGGEFGFEDSDTETGPVVESVDEDTEVSEATAEGPQGESEEDDTEEESESDEDEDDSEDDESEEDESDQEDEDDDSESEEDEDDWLVKGRFKRGEEDKLSKSYSELEKLHSRTINELREQIQAERQAAQEQIQALIDRVREPVQAPQDPMLQQQRIAQLAMYALQDGYGAYGAALESGDEAAVRSVIAAVQTGSPEHGIEGNPLMAEELRGDYYSRRLQEQEAVFKAKAAKVEGETAMKSGLARFRSDYPEHAEVKAEMGEWMKPRLAKIDATNEEDVYALLVDAYEVALGRKAREAKTIEPEIRKQVKKAKQKATVETGTHKAPSKRKPKKDVTEVASGFADDLVSLSQATSYK